MTTIGLYNDFKKQLEAIYDAREADNISDWVFENVTGKKKWERRMSNEEISRGHSDLLQNYLQQLLQQKPVQYVLSEAWFFKRKFYVDVRVLIPRPETEELLEWIVSDVRSTILVRSTPFGDGRFSVLDIGAGSGCIPVTLKKEIPFAEISSMDVSEKALEVARKNSQTHGAAIDFFRMDFLEESNWNALPLYDIIVSNPPYIPLSEKGILNKNVSGFEPGTALFVEDKDPFIFYFKIALFARSHLKKTGEIYVEVHEKYALPVKRVFEKQGFQALIKKDIYGNERMIKATFI